MCGRWWGGVVGWEGLYQRLPYALPDASSAAERRGGGGSKVCTEGCGRGAHRLGLWLLLD